MVLTLGGYSTEGIEEVSLSTAGHGRDLKRMGQGYMLCRSSERTHSMAYWETCGWPGCLVGLVQGIDCTIYKN